MDSSGLAFWTKLFQAAQTLAQNSGALIDGSGWFANTPPAVPDTAKINEVATRAGCGRVAWLLPPAPGLRELRAAEYLRAVHACHDPDGFDRFRPLMVEALERFGLGRSLMGRALGDLAPEERWELEYLALFLKPWDAIVVVDGPRHADTIAGLLRERTGFALALREGWAPHALRLELPAASGELMMGWPVDVLQNTDTSEANWSEASPCLPLFYGLESSIDPVACQNHHHHQPRSQSIVSESVSPLPSLPTDWEKPQSLTSELWKDARTLALEISKRLGESVRGRACRLAALDWLRVHDEHRLVAIALERGLVISKPNHHFKLLATEFAPLGVKIAELGQAMDEEDFVGEPPTHGTAALSSAFCEAGIVINIEPHARPGRPLPLVLPAELGAGFHRVIIRAGQGACLEIIDACVTPKLARGPNRGAWWQVSLGQESQLALRSYQEWTKGLSNLVSREFVLAEGAILDWVDCHIGSPGIPVFNRIRGGVVKLTNLTVSAEGDPAYFDFLGAAGQILKRSVAPLGPVPGRVVTDWSREDMLNLLRSHGMNADECCELVLKDFCAPAWRALPDSYQVELLTHLAALAKMSPDSPRVPQLI